MPEWENEFDSEWEVSEEQAKQLHRERLEEIEIQIEQDERPLESDADDFQKVTDWWDKLDENRELCLSAPARVGCGMMITSGRRGQTAVSI